jgi:hypothetical protein
MILDDKNEILRVKSLEILSNEIKNLLKLIDKREDELTTFNKELINSIKNNDIKIQKSENHRIIIPHLQPRKSDKEVLPKTIKNKDKNHFSSDSFYSTFNEFFRWIKDDYYDIEKQVKPKIDNSEVKPKLKSQQKSDIDEIAQQIETSDNDMLTLLGIGGGVFLGKEVFDTDEKKPEVKPHILEKSIQTNEIESAEIKKNIEMDLSPFGIDIKNNKIDEKYKQTTVKALDKVVDTENMSGKIIQNISTKYESDTTQYKTGGIAKVEIETGFSDTLGHVNISRYETPEISITTNKGNISDETKSEIDNLKKFNREYYRVNETSSFNYWDFINKFKEVSFDKIKTYYSFGNKKLWENDKEIITQQLKLMFSKNSSDNSIIDMLLTQLFDNVERNIPTSDFSVDENSKWMLKLNNKKTGAKQAVENQVRLEKSETEYDILTRKYDAKLIDFKAFDDNNEVAISDVIKAYNIWELSVYRHYHTWGFDKKERLKRLDSEFKRFWKRLIVSVEYVKNMDKIYSVIKNTKYQKLYSNFNKKDYDEKIDNGSNILKGVTSNINKKIESKQKVTSPISLGEKFSTQYKALSGNYKNIFIDSSNSLGGLNNDVLANLIGMTEEAMNLGIIDGKIPINSAYRDYKSQVTQWNRNYKNGKLEASLPFVSPHAFGIAVDINSNILDKFDSSGLMNKWGFARPYMQGDSESWHLQSVTHTNDYDKLKLQGDNYKFIKLKKFITKNPSLNFEIPTNLTESETRQFLLRKYEELLNKKSVSNDKINNQTVNKTINTTDNLTTQSDEFIEEVSETDIYESEIEPQNFQ